jgi:hypothetical protein
MLCKEKKIAALLRVREEKKTKPIFLFGIRSCGGKGCKRHYHLSCIDPPLDVSLGIWLCIMCIKKRLQFGVYSISEGIESLWDVKEGKTIT